MKILGLSFVHNAEADVQGALDSMAVDCDEVCVVDDRSTDGTGEILRQHDAVSNVFTIDPTISPNLWHFSESRLLALLYRMADLSQPDWIVMISGDERLIAAGGIRETLAIADSETAGFQTHLISTWADPDYPFMVPIMGQARSLVQRIWRYSPGLVPGTKRLHNRYSPVNISDFGRAEFLSDISIEHTGWSSLAERIDRVDSYSALDPGNELNEGVPYDIGLLFGYERDRVSDLVQEYHRRVERIRGYRDDDLQLPA